MMNNNKSKRKKCQHQKEFIGLVQKAHRELDVPSLNATCLEKAIRRLHLSRQKVLDFLIYTQLCLKGKPLFISQAESAEKTLNMARETFNRAVNKDLIPLGLVATARPAGFNVPKVYKLLPDLLKRKTLDRLSDVLPMSGEFIRTLQIKHLDYHSTQVTLKNNKKKNNIYINILDYNKGPKPGVKLDFVHEDGKGPKGEHWLSRYMKKLAANEKARNEFLVSHDFLSPISHEVRNITQEINLNKRGQILLSQFPEYALEQSLALYKKRLHSLTDPLLWIKKVAASMSKKRMPILTAMLFSMTGLSSNGPTMISSKIDPIIAEKSTYVRKLQCRSENNGKSNYFPSTGRDIKNLTSYVCNAYITTNRHLKNKLQTFKTQKEIHSKWVPYTPLRAEYYPGEYEPGFISKADIKQASSILSKMYSHNSSVSHPKTGMRSIADHILGVKKNMNENKEVTIADDLKMLRLFRLHGMSLSEIYETSRNDSVMESRVGKEIFNKFITYKRMGYL